MRISTLSTKLSLILLGNLFCVASIAIEKRDADFNNVRTNLQKNFNNENPKEPNKYFHEARFDPHYDGRFTDGRLPYEHHRSSLILLAQTCLTTLNDIGVETWIMHGSLLGWYWNRRILPWDSDIDLQISEKSIDHLAQYYNMSTHRFRVGKSTLRRNYLLEINPHYTNVSTADKVNMIDARWIDTDTGLFLDLTTLRRNATAEEMGFEGAMMCKDGHHYQYDDIFPLRETTFEGVPAKVPFAYSDILVEEYKGASLSTTVFEGHFWNETAQEWMPYSRAPPRYARAGLSSFTHKLEAAAKEMAGADLASIEKE